MSGLVQRACSVFVAAGIETAEAIGQAEQKSQLLDAEVGVGGRRVPAPGVGGFYQGLEDIHGGTLDTVAEKEFVRAGEAVDRRHEPQDEAVMAVEGRPGLPRPVAGDLRL